jgi:hypothetical protein
MQTIDLQDDELVLLIQLLNKHVVEVQREQVRTKTLPHTPFEADLLARLVAISNEPDPR